MSTVPYLLGAALLLLGVANCEEAPRARSAATRDPNVRTIAADDREMQAAIARARASTGELSRRLAEPPSSQTFLSVKVRVADGHGGEHIWLDSVRSDGRQLSGRLNDEPKIVQHVRRGDVVHLSLDEITDWMAIDGGRLCGGYTLRVARRRLSAGDRATLEQDPRIVRVPTDTSSCARPD